MSEPEIRDETLIALLRERGYEVVSREPEEPQPEPEPPPRDPRREFAEKLLGQLNASRTPWISAGGGSDGED